jgi:hypothetical protein
MTEDWVELIVKRWLHGEWVERKVVFFRRGQEWQSDDGNLAIRLSTQTTKEIEK